MSAYSAEIANKKNDNFLQYNRESCKHFEWFLGLLISVLLKTRPVVKIDRIFKRKLQKQWSVNKLH